jgi:hypothetical protein
VCPVSLHDFTSIALHHSALTDQLHSESQIKSNQNFIFDLGVYNKNLSTEMAIITEM